MKQIGILIALGVVLVLAGIYAWKKWQYYNPRPPAAEVPAVELITTA